LAAQSQPTAATGVTDEQMRRVRLARAMYLAKQQIAEDEAESKRKADEVAAKLKEDALQAEQERLAQEEKEKQKK